MCEHQEQSITFHWFTTADRIRERERKKETRRQHYYTENIVPLELHLRFKCFYRFVRLIRVNLKIVYFRVARANFLLCVQNISVKFNAFRTRGKCVDLQIRRVHNKLYIISI